MWSPCPRERLRGQESDFKLDPFSFTCFFPPPHPPTSDPLFPSRLFHFHVSIFFSSTRVPRVPTSTPTPTDPSELQPLAHPGYPKSQPYGAEGGESLPAAASPPRWVLRPGPSLESALARRDLPSGHGSASFLRCDLGTKHFHSRSLRFFPLQKTENAR